MSNEIKPVAWTVAEQLEKVAAGEIGFIAQKHMIEPVADIPLYPQSTIDHLTAERDSLRHERGLLLEQIAKMDERAAYLAEYKADAERYRWLRDECQEPYSLIAEYFQDDFDAAIDAVRKESE